jgi:hypothetical protein
MLIEMDDRSPWISQSCARLYSCRPRKVQGRGCVPSAYSCNSTPSSQEFGFAPLAGVGR